MYTNMVTVIDLILTKISNILSSLLCCFLAGTARSINIYLLPRFTMTTILLETGMRISELCHLKTGDLFFYEQ